MRKLASFLVSVTIFPLLLTGCWDYVEVDHLATVLAMGIDRIPGSQHILLTVQVVAPEAKGGSKKAGAGGEEKAFTVLSSEGKSLSDALRNLGMQSPRRIALSHNKLIVLGKNLAETGIGDILDELDRNKEIRRTVWMLTTDITAREILANKTALERLPAEGLEQILMKDKNLGLAAPINRNDFYAHLNSDSHVSFTPFVQLEEIDKKVTRQLEKAAGRSVDSGENSKTPTISKIAVFKNLRLTGVLNETESRAQQWLIDKPQGESLTFTYATPSEQSGDEKEISLDILDGQTNITPQVSEDGITMNLSIKARTSLRESGIAGLNLLDPQVVADMEYQAAETIKSQLEQVIDKAQKELNVDYIGFAESLHNSYPAEWKRVKNKWDDIFPTVNYQITCNVKILRFGMINNPSQKSDQEE